MVLLYQIFFLLQFKILKNQFLLETLYMYSITHK